MAKKVSKNNDLVSNRKAGFNYEILETYEAGVQLKGTEIKSLRDGGGSLQEAFIKEENGELWLYGCSISPYKYGNIHNHDERRPKKLLLHKREIAALAKSFHIKGNALIPLAFYLKNGRVKCKVGIGHGKKMHDKRATIKERDVKRQIQREFKQ
ncbi:MAG: SsrA-binding protein SmpB [Chlamydiia bacterium]|nr:SsrA-binding protein SmpB [Chlamydiia bacterium]